MKQARSPAVFYVSALLSLILSCWIAFQNNIINPDGICYLQSAALIGNAGLHASLKLCPQSSWPFYPLLIHGVVILTHLSYYSAAMIINALFSLLIVLGFIAILQQINAPKKIVWLGAVVILLFHEYNSLRDEIVRDHGFWAFYLLSLYLYLIYIKNSRWCFAIAWSMSLIIATLFRIEGIIYLILLPFATLMQRDKHRLTRCYEFFKLNLLTFVILSIGLICILFFSHLNLTRLIEIKHQLLNGKDLIFQRFQTSSHALGQFVLSPYAAGDSSILLGLFLFTWYLFAVISNVSAVYAAFAVYGKATMRQYLQKTDWLIIHSYIAISVLITAIFLMENMFLSKRYLIALSLVLCLYVPFGLERARARLKIHKYGFIMLILILILSQMSGLISFGYSKKYIRDAGVWAAQNTPLNVKLFSNDQQVMYYTQRFGNDIFTAWRYSTLPYLYQNNHWQAYDYLLLRTDKYSANSVASTLKLQPIKTFMNKRGDQVNIYAVPRELVR